MRNRPVIDWSRCALNITERITQREAARRLGLSESYLRSLIENQNREPRFWNGVLLLDLHHEVCPDKHRELLIRRGS